jgi:hypothetical protein
MEGDHHTGSKYERIGVIRGSRKLFKKFVQQGRSEQRGEAYSVPYVDPLSDARTQLAGLFNSLSGFCLAVIQMPVLPVEPGMPQFVCEDIASPRHRKLFPQVNRFQLVVPNAIGIGVTAVHFTVRKLAHGDPISKG